MDKKDFKPLGPFKGWVLQNFPFIEADFDAITNYELLCKIVEYVNKIGYNQELLEESNDELIDAFNELKTYVESYLENLDVQGYVDNKLDEMAESGELSEIIGEYIQVSGILAYNTLDDLVNATNLANGSFTRIFGKLEYNDGLGTYYKIRSVLTTDVIDGDNIIALVNYPELVGEKIFSKDINDLKEDVANNTEEIENIKEDYLPLSGGSITGNLSVGETFNVGSGKLVVGNTYVNSNMQIRSDTGIIIGQTTDTVDRQLTIRNQGHQANFVAKAAGNFGLWSTTMNKYVFVTYPADGRLELNGKLIIANDGISTFSNDIRLKKTNTNAYIYIGDTAYRKINEVQTENDSIKVGLGTDTNGTFRIYDYTHSKDILRDSNGTITFNGSANGNILNKNVARGVVSITPSGANTPTSVNVTWSQMDGIPTVVAIPNVGDGLTAIYNVGVTDITKTGCKLWLRASNTNARNVMYIAIYK